MRNARWPTRCTLMGCTAPDTPAHHHHYVHGHLNVRTCHCDDVDERGTRPAALPPSRVRALSAVFVADATTTALNAGACATFQARYYLSAAQVCAIERDVERRLTAMLNTAPAPPRSKA